MAASADGETPQPTTWARIGRVALQSVAAVAVAYAFVLLLLVGTAQQRVDDALAKENVGYDYSVAIRYFLDSTELTGRAQQKSDDVRNATDALRGARSKLDAANRQLDGQTTRLRQVINAVAGSCGLQGVSQELTAQELIAAAATVEDCVPSADAAGGVPPARQIEVAQQGVERALDNAADLANRIEDQEAGLKLLEAERDNINEQINAAARSSSILEILRIFDESDWLLRVPLIRMPPALTGIILTSVSGMFGALLITLILFVYPDNPYEFTRSKSYFGRILLGGLIALGVFVLLFSGVAVLGGADGSGSAQNLIAYSAIGLLAGMFSDQAAGWLSKKSVFKLNGEGGEGGGAAGGNAGGGRGKRKPGGNAETRTETETGS